ncbi:hypothetical protein SLA2020_123490 [Shorea laevis]
MEEEVDLVGLNKGKEPVVAGNRELLHDPVAPMEATATPSPEAQTVNEAHTHRGQSNPTSSTPPPAMSTDFVKPKPKPSKKKAKILGPIPKETKNSAQKPYDLPLLPKKQTSHTPKMLPSIQSHSSSPPQASTVKLEPPLLLPVSLTDLSPPLTQSPIASKLDPPFTVSNPGTETLLLQASHVNSLVVVQDTATLPSTFSQ